ncbi:MAG: hypothetical protein HC927_02425 [Deltaproteobacteria bacterium]|nr:hypothetical protein [Deltaproteobacteria bacterium]
MKRRGDVPAGIMEILKVGLAVEPEQRHESMAALMAKLEAVPEVVALRKLTTPEERMREETERKRQWRKFWWWIGGILVGWPSIIVVLVLASWPAEEKPRHDIRSAADTNHEDEELKVTGDVRVASALARAGRPFEAWEEFQRANEQIDARVTTDQALDLAEELLRVAPALRKQQRQDAYDAAAYVVVWTDFQLRHVDDAETDRNRAIGLRDRLVDLDPSR